MLTLLTPVATRYSVYGMIAVRAGEGLMLVRNNVFVLSQTKLNYEWLNVGLPNSFPKRSRSSETSVSFSVHHDWFDV